MLSAETSEFLEAATTDLYDASNEQLEDESSLLFDDLASMGADLDFPKQVSADFYLHAVYDSLLFQRAHTVAIGIKSLLSLCGQQSERQQLLTQLWNLLDPQAASLVSAFFSDIRQDQLQRTEEPDLYEIATIGEVLPTQTISSITSGSTPKSLIRLWCCRFIKVSHWRLARSGSSRFPMSPTARLRMHWSMRRGPNQYPF